MASEMRSSAILRFGTFEADLRAGELRKQGKRLKLQDQPFQVLSVLLKRSGDVVTREQLRAQIWPEDTFVDFDNGLNVAINKLREALSDSADNPRFIETLPRRGYRFIAPVNGSNLKKRVVYAGRWKIAATVAIVIVVVAVAAGEWFWHSHQKRVLSDKDIIVVGDFANSTGDSVFDGTLREGFSVQLEQSPFLSLVSEEGIHETLRMMGQPTNARLTPEITREVCQRTNSTAALDGSIALIGAKYQLILKAVKCVNGDVLASTEAPANDKSGVLDALSISASEMRRKLGESGSIIQKYDTPLEQATTPSLEALQAYSLGFRLLSAGDYAEALPSLQRAVQLDSNFAMAYWAIATGYAGLGESILAAENSLKAFEKSAEVSERERLIIEGDYYLYSLYDLTRARRSYALGTQTFPREAAFHINLGTLFNILGQYEAGLRESREGFRLAPYSSLFCRYVVYTHLLMNQADAAEATVREARVAGLDFSLAGVRYALAFYRNNPAEMERQVATAVNKPGAEDLLLALHADTAGYFGHRQKAYEFSRRAAESAEQAGENETAVEYRAVSALRDALFGDELEAQRAIPSQRCSAGRDVRYACALVLAFAGDYSRAQRLSDELAKDFPEDTVVRFDYLPTVQASLAIGRSNLRQAAEVLEVARPYELGLALL